MKAMNQGTALAMGTLALPPLVIEGLEEFKGSFDRLCLQAGTSAIEAMLAADAEDGKAEPDTAFPRDSVGAAAQGAVTCNRPLLRVTGPRCTPPQNADQARSERRSRERQLADPDPDQQRQADEAMHTESGKAGKTEPSSHAPSGDGQVLQDGKLKPSAPTNAPSNSARQ
jgi:hypothetical protein